jgi:hypothetical protein
LCIAQGDLQDCISELEWAFVGAANKGPTHFRCWPCGGEFAKGSALAHFTGKKHALQEEVVKRWLVVRDGYRFRKNRSQSSYKLEAALAAIAGEGKEETCDPDDSALALQAIANVGAEPKAAAPPLPEPALAPQPLPAGWKVVQLDGMTLYYDFEHNVLQRENPYQAMRSQSVNGESVNSKRNA